jgi:hypothetical protein
MNKKKIEHIQYYLLSQDGNWHGKPENKLVNLKATMALRGKKHTRTHTKGRATCSSWETC